ncbi:efflux transporter outer membrane subunit [Sphingomonas quercus]|uniref:Efflux transporter outer membrane subunit n=1 Tax=Sphingomonas quercus TaxID=2842451 RepID=A0ABS6BGM8_9SPHN|nr:efflux transporter outer membrane subunit [Sphingomonas quercus]MBU3077450.1 efflux transporter outer membrane subunit [Sphingomonas quercus]
MRTALPPLLMLAACAGPAVETARVDPVAPPATWRTDAGPAAPLDRRWWNGFGDPALTALVERALAYNPDIAIAGARLREARANIIAARAQVWPAVDAGLAAGRSRTVSGIGTPLNQNFVQPQLQVGYELDLFGRLADQRAAARDAYLASAAARDAIRLSVAGTVASSYITLLSLDARLEVTRQTLQARADSLRIARSRVTNGYSPKLELEQAQAEYESAAQLIPQLQLAIDRVEAALSLLTGATPGDIARGRGLDALRQPPVPEGLPSDLLRRRPDIAQAEYQLAAADASLAVARKRFLPQFRLSATAGTAFSNALADPITLWSLGSSILAPLFQGGRLEAQAEAAGAQRDQAAFAYRRAVLASFRDVEDALSAAARLDQQVAGVTRQRDALAEGLRLATNRYREGYSPFLEQLDAQRGLLSVELSLIQIRADALAARVQLYQAMGGGWSADSLAALAADAR